MNHRAAVQALQGMAFSHTHRVGFPLGLENLGKWEGIFQLGNFEQNGKVRENHTKYWKTWDNGKAFSSWVGFEQNGTVRENHTKSWKTQGISEKCYLIMK